MPELFVTLDDLVREPTRAMTLSVSDAALLLAQAGAVEAVLRAQLLAGMSGAGITPNPLQVEKREERMLTLAEAAERIRKSVRWLRDHWRKEMPFARKVGKSILFPESAVDRWVRRT